jgi:tetratricopeptide (TPR) repeat protein
MFGFSPYLMALTFRGVLFRMMGRLDEAARDLDRAAELARAHGQLEILGYAQQAYVFLAYARGDLDDALSHARDALAMAERIDSPFSRTQAYESLGIAHLGSGRWPEARDAFERALAIMRETGTGFTDEAFYLAGLARAHLGAGDLAAARARAEEAVAAGESRRTRFAACEAYLALGEVLVAHDDREAWAAAEHALTKALAGVGETGAATSEPFVHMALAALARRRGDRPAERRELETARRLFLAIGAPARADATARALEATG